MAARDVLMIGVLLFTFAIGFFIINYVVGEVVTDMTETPTLNDTTGFSDTMGGITKVTGRLDYVVFGLFIGLILSLIITGWFIGGNPIYMFIYFIVTIIAVVLATFFANVWEQVSETAIFGTNVASFTLTNNIMLNLPIYMAVVGFIGLIAMFAKPFMESK